MSMGLIILDDVGALSDAAKISVTDAAAVSHTVTAGKKGVSLQNTGSDPVWYGGSTVDPGNNRGNKLFPNQAVFYRNVKDTFKIYFKCDTGETATISVVENV